MPDTSMLPTVLVESDKADEAARKAALKAASKMAAEAAKEIALHTALNRIDKWAAARKVQTDKAEAALDKVDAAHVAETCAAIFAATAAGITDTQMERKGVGFGKAYIGRLSIVGRAMSRGGDGDANATRKFVVNAVQVKGCKIEHLRTACDEASSWEDAMRRMAAYIDSLKSDEDEDGEEKPKSKPKTITDHAVAAGKIADKIADLAKGGVSEVEMGVLHALVTKFNLLLAADVK